MKQDRQRGSYTMELVAIISVLCIAAIFVFSHLSRQTQAYDDQARAAAGRLAPVVEGFFQEHPQDRLSEQALVQAGFQLPEPLQMRISPQHDRAADWEVMIWHPQGEYRFLVKAGGVTAVSR